MKKDYSILYGVDDYSIDGIRLVMEDDTVMLRYSVAYTVYDCDVIDDFYVPVY